MTEKQLIAKIKELRQIQPRKDWVVLTKERILSDEEFAIVRQYGRGPASIGLKELLEGIRIIFQHKYAFASLVVLAVLIGTFGFAQKSLPGDMLYSVKKAAEKTHTVFISEKEQPKRRLELANKRLDELTKIAQNNSVKNLAPAINEYKASVLEAAKNLVEDARKNPDTVKKIVEEVKQIEEKTEQIQALGVEIGESEELDNALSQIYKQYVEWEIKDLENRTLTERQKEVLAEAKKDCENGNYAQAFEKILLLPQP